MNLNWTVIGIAGAAFFLGYLIGLYEGRWKHKRLAQKLAQERDAARQDRQKTLEALTALREEYEKLQDRPAPALSLEEKQGETLLSLDGRLLTPVELTDAQHKRLLSLLNALTPYVKRRAPSPSRPETPPKASARPPVAPPASPPSAAPQGQPAPSVASPKGGSIVEQIDAILQTMLENTPLDSRGIRLQEGPDGGVVVWVGLSRYASVNDVPEAEIQAVIQAAIKAWESRI